MTHEPGSHLWVSLHDGSRIDVYDTQGMDGLARLRETLTPQPTAMDIAVAQEERRLARAADQAAIESQLTVGSRTLLDLPYGPPPDQLVPPFLTPEGATVLYAPGGTGKGWVSVHFALELVRKGIRVMVLDFEHHESEWGNRARMLGATDDELAMVAYRAPFGDDWTQRKGALDEIADLLRADCDDLGIGYVVIDSYTAATSTGDTMGGAAGAQEFYAGLRVIGRPSLVIAHVAGASGRFPDKPFGSVHVHNFARETWAVEKTDEGQVEPVFDPETWRLQPNVMTLELRNKKRNGGPQPRPQFVSFSFYFDGHVEVGVVQPKPKSQADLIHDLLEQAGRPMTVEAIVKALKSETDTKLVAGSVRKILARNLDRFMKDETSLPSTWTTR